MSNDLATMFSGALAPIEGLDEDTLAVAGGARSNKRISIKGGVFRKYSGGKEIGAIEDRHMNVIFVKMAHKASRMFYDATYDQGWRVPQDFWRQGNRRYRRPSHERDLRQDGSQSLPHVL